MSLDLDSFGFGGSSGGGSPSPSGFAYQKTRPVLISTQITTGDSAYWFEKGAYDRAYPVTPAVFPKVDPNATQADVRAVPATGTNLTDRVYPTILEEDNVFGNRFRFTDSIGNPSDASVGSNIWAHVDWRNHSFSGAIGQYIIDHTSGWGYSTEYLTIGGKYNMDITQPHGQNWAAWMLDVVNLTNYKGFSGWIPYDLSEDFALAQAVQTVSWATDFLTFESSQVGATRGSVITGEAYGTDYLPFYDSGNGIVIQPNGQAGGSGFIFRIANCFIKRKHY